MNHSCLKELGSILLLIYINLHEYIHKAYLRIFPHFSSVSSALNSLAAVFLEDIIKPLATHINREFSDHTGVWISKAVGKNRLKFILLEDNSLAAVFLEDIIKPLATHINREFSDKTGVWISKGVGKINNHLTFYQTLNNILSYNFPHTPCSFQFPASCSFSSLFPALFSFLSAPLLNFSSCSMLLLELSCAPCSFLCLLCSFTALLLCIKTGLLPAPELPLIGVHH